jgi:hypothetical protein
MKATVVRYQAKPERADENQALVEKVFADLEARQPDGFTYKVFRLEDGVSFIHVVIEHEVESPDSLQSIPAFRLSWRASPSVATSRQFRWEQPSSAAIGEHVWLLARQPRRRRLIRGTNFPRGHHVPTSAELPPVASGAIHRVSQCSRNTRPPGVGSGSKCSTRVRPGAQPLSLTPSIAKDCLLAFCTTG